MEDAIQEIACEICIEEYNMDFHDVPDKIQQEIWSSNF